MGFKSGMGDRRPFASGVEWASGELTSGVARRNDFTSGLGHRTDFTSGVGRRRNFS